MPRIEINELQLEEVDFVSLSQKQLVDLFNKHKKLSIQIDEKNRLDLTYVEGHNYGIRFTELINLLHVERLPRHYTDEADFERDKPITDKLLSPLDFGKAIKKFVTYYQKFKEGKIMKIDDLTDEEIDHIVMEMNKPIGEDRE